MRTFFLIISLVGLSFALTNCKIPGTEGGSELRATSGGSSICPDEKQAERLAVDLLEKSGKNAMARRIFRWYIEEMAASGGRNTRSLAPWFVAVSELGEQVVLERLSKMEGFKQYITERENGGLKLDDRIENVEEKFMTEFDKLMVVDERGQMEITKVFQEIHLRKFVRKVTEGLNAQVLNGTLTKQEAKEIYREHLKTTAENVGRVFAEFQAQAETSTTSNKMLERQMPNSVRVAKLVAVHSLNTGNNFLNEVETVEIRKEAQKSFSEGLTNQTKEITSRIANNGRSVVSIQELAEIRKPLERLQKHMRDSTELESIRQKRLNAATKEAELKTRRASISDYAPDISANGIAEVDAARRELQSAVEKLQASKGMSKAEFVDIQKKVELAVARYERTVTNYTREAVKPHKGRG